MNTITKCAAAAAVAVGLALSGWASSATEISAASDIARSVEGVKSVDNQLQVKR
jgi:osmotically-inducible protein OsmY